MNIASRLTGILIAGLLGAVGCSQRPASDDSWERVTPTAMTSTQKDQKDRALAAKEAMFGQLMGKLMKEIGNGPADAIAICQEEAPRIAEQVAKEKGVKIGRTAVKLRNVKNQPPAWARDLLNQGTSEPTFLKNNHGDFAALLPIKLQAQCLQCHGNSEQIPAAVRDALSQRYPTDQATGFKEGDLRGWFWIEVPAR